MLVFVDDVGWWIDHVEVSRLLGEERGLNTQGSHRVNSWSVESC